MDEGGKDFSLEREWVVLILQQILSLSEVKSETALTYIHPTFFKLSTYSSTVCLGTGN